MAGIWICKNCHHVGQDTYRGGHTTLPSCEACGHSTIIPVDTPSGMELADKIGVDSTTIAVAAYRSEIARRRRFPMGTRILGFAMGCLTGVTCVAANLPTGSTVWFILAVYCGISIAIHRGEKPDPPPGIPPITD